MLISSSHHSPGRPDTTESLHNAGKKSAVNSSYPGDGSRFVNKLLKVLNSPVEFLKSKLSSILTKETSHFHRQQNMQVVVKDFMRNQLSSLDISGQGKKDPVYARQTWEATMSSVYSEMKDAFCKEAVSKGPIPKDYLKEIGLAAKNAGLPGKENNGIFVPSGAGANPFVTSIISAVQKRFPYMIDNSHQQQFIKNHAIKLITHEVNQLSKAAGLMSPDAMKAELAVIAAKYHQ